MNCAAATGVEVYQVSLPSRLAAASSTGSGLKAAPASCALAGPPAVPTQIPAASSAAHATFIASSRQFFSTIALLTRPNKKTSVAANEYQCTDHQDCRPRALCRGQ